MAEPTRRDALRWMTVGAAGMAIGGCEREPNDAPGPPVSGPKPPPLPREWRAAWVASVNNIDWPSRPGLTVEDQQAEIGRIVTACADLHLNAIILQVRPTADAFYPSKIEPWSAYLTGRSGVAPSPEYDPLAHWIDQAHRAGLDIHVWVNPFRARHPQSVGSDARTHISRTHPHLVREYGDYLWLDPGDPEARSHALRVVADILDRYPVEGLHMDDYFYPYPVDGRPFDDEVTFARFGRGRALSDWRRSNIDALVLDLRRVVRERLPGGIFTISPFGIWRPGQPEGVVGLDAFQQLAADSRKWLREGWVDALMPQLYWKIESEGQAYEPLLDWWREQNVAGRHLWPGLYLTRVKPPEVDGSWAPDDITRQIEIAQAKPDVGGVTLFSAVGLVDNRRGIADAIGRTFAGPAFVPPTEWVGGARPSPPQATIEGQNVRFEPGATGQDVRRWALQVRQGRTWTVASVPGPSRHALVGSADEVLVASVGGNGVTSPFVRGR